ncbi:DUF4843 domain-containing protein [Chitinophaga silvatica]|uniref:DUF4843 domain-containing protein n=1 Tax=Chitinophaga silvatica TaxID=2282649 RepID=A0A3E1Y8C0_9BACT|nr:DUF4843 domain-containing protein [Chitinophaga silvatica]RFS21699.1 DUF4843 domain-containing protein [Chitinophaga silvatica]
MQYINKSIIAILIGITLGGCKKISLTTYDAGRYLQFTGDYRDTISLSFFLYPKQEQFNIALPVKVTGKMTEQDLSYSLKVNDATTAVTSLFTVPATYTLRKTLPIDTAYVTIKKLPELKGKEVLLVLDMAGGPELQIGQTINSRRVIRISDKISKPSWWDAVMESTYLGKYTDKKFSMFIQVVGEGNISIYSDEKKRDMMLQFKYYLIKMRDAGTPVLEDDGTDMLSTIPLIG